MQDDTTAPKKMVTDSRRMWQKGKPREYGNDRRTDRRKRRTATGERTNRVGDTRGKNGG